MASPDNRRPARHSRRRNSTQQLKVHGEDAAAELLKAKGLKVIARNWRTRFGELDLVALDGTTLVFVEVKARQLADFVEPAQAVDRTKQRKIRRLAEAYLAFEHPQHEACRFDVVSVVAGAPVRIRHLTNAF